MGNAPTTVDVPHLLNNEIWKRLNKLDCGQLGIDEGNISVVSIHPNPALDEITVDLNEKFLYIQILDSHGRVLRIEKTQKIDFKQYPKGIYGLRILLENGNWISEKIIKI